MACENHPEVEVGLITCSGCGVQFCGDCVVELQGQKYCAVCKTEQVRDIVSGTDATALDLASIGRRFGAVFIDGLIFSIPAFIIMFLLFLPMIEDAGNSDEPAEEVGIMVSGFLVFAIFGWPVLLIIYEGIMLQVRGQTLGKMALGIKVTTAQGDNISAGQAWGRALAKTVFSNFLSVVNYLPALFSKQRTCLHDMAAKTRVVNWSR